MSHLRDAIYDAREAMMIPNTADRQHIREHLQRATHLLQEGLNQRFSDERKAKLRRAYDEAKRERDLAEERLNDAQQRMMRAWYAMRDAETP